MTVSEKKRVKFKTTNLNTEEIRDLLMQLISHSLDKEKFNSFFPKENLSKNHEFLFSLTKVARLNFGFLDYCKLVKIFSTWNHRYQVSYQSSKMFKNMILKRQSGENFPITCPEDLKQKLEVFNENTGLRIVTYLDILDCSSNALIIPQINPKQYMQIVYLILKCINKQFEREVCRRVYKTFHRIGDVERANEFR